jgi:glycogen debranching enzyme
MVHKIRLGEEWYILATTSPVDERRRVLKHNDLFGLFDRFGDVQSIGLGEEGLYFGDTCFLSSLELQIGGVRPMFLNSTVKETNELFVIELMNPDLYPEGLEPIPKGVLHVFRAKLLLDNACYEHIRVVNYGLERVQTELALHFGADYKDIFEVRGFQRNKRGTDLSPDVMDSQVVLGYRGLDDSVRRTRLHFDPAPVKLEAHAASFKLDLVPKGEAHFYCTVCCEQDQVCQQPMDYFTAFQQASKAQAESESTCRISSSDQLFNRWVDRSASDLVMLGTRTAQGIYPYAGLPWYSTTFGRDGILTAWEYLWVDPMMARGVLDFLAQTQAHEVNPERDAEPGKILHEAREGELAALDEIPFRRYYGTVDATPLFVGLAGAYFERTGDFDFIRSIWDNIKRALAWIDDYGDRDGDGFVEYARYRESGLAQQGWKDSHDSIFHRDGKLAEAPIALCEVQGYVYDARRQAARLARLMGEDKLAQKQEDAATSLKLAFNEVFWNEEMGLYALALDGHKRPCLVAASNAGHALWSGIATPERAQRIAQRLLEEDMFCGWGIRTIARGESRYNPMAYHNGSVWPHDNALIAAGMARYGLTEAAMRVFEGLHEVSLYMDQHRMPELFCGFERRKGEGPTSYPVACSPQAWAAASVFYLLQACLGMSFSPEKHEIRFRNPQLPSFLDNIKIKDLRLGDACVHLALQRYQNNVGINILEKQGHVNVMSVA